MVKSKTRLSGLTYMEGGSIALVENKTHSEDQLHTIQKYLSGIT